MLSSATSTRTARDVGGEGSGSGETKLVGVRAGEIAVGDDTDDIDDPLVVVVVPVTSVGGRFDVVVVVVFVVVVFVRGERGDCGGKICGNCPEFRGEGFVGLGEV